MAAAHDTHHGSTKHYWIIGAILAVVTAVEVFMAWPGTVYDFHNPDPTAFIILMVSLVVMMVVKGLFVVASFMHLKGDATVFKLLFIVPFALAVSYIIAILAIFSYGAGVPGIAG
jgi:cytochrome c oxidase subunit 4